MFSVGLFLQNEKKENLVGIFAALMFISLFSVGLGMSQPLLSILIERAGESASFNGTNTATAGLGTLLTAPFVARFAAHLGMKNLSITAVLLALLSLTIFLLTEPSWTWFVARLILGMTTGVLFITSESWINALIEQKNRGIMMGIYGSVVSCSFVIGPLLLLFMDTNDQMPFATIAFLFLLCLFPVYWAQATLPQFHKKRKRSLLTFLLTLPTAALAGLTFGATQAASQSLFPVYALRLGYAEQIAILMVFMISVGGILIPPFLGALSDRYSRNSVLLICGIFGAVSILPFLFISSPVWILSLLLVIFGGCICSLYTIGLAQITERFKGFHQVSANSAFVTLHSTGVLLGPAVTGLGMEIFPSHGLIYTLCIFFVPFIILMSTHGRRKKRKPLSFRSQGDENPNKI